MLLSWKYESQSVLQRLWIVRGRKKVSGHSYQFAVWTAVRDRLCRHGLQQVGSPVGALTESSFAG